MNDLQMPRAAPVDGDQDSALAGATAGSSFGAANDTPAGSSDETTGLHPFHHARALVKLIQCSQCSFPLRSPVTLPCGNSLCRQCLPPPHQREFVSYPAVASRQAGVTCPFPECGLVHPLEGAAVCVVLLKVADAISAEVTRERASHTGTETSMEEVMNLSQEPSSGGPEEPTPSEKGHSRTLRGGRLVATYTFAEMGELPYNSDVIYHPTPTDSDDGMSLDVAVLEKLKDACVKEFDCHVCYNMMLDPVTTPCGHTFCRKCLARVLDHSTLCPHCRQNLPLPPSLRHQKNNSYLVQLLSSLCPDQVAAREAASQAEEASGGLDTPLFVCTVSLPEMPMILHIFEPRYRLMVRRAVEGNRQFGMVAYNERGETQGDLGVTQFMETGIMLEIEQCRFFPDGRSWLFCRGVSRFKVVEHDMRDGYVVGRVERHSDISLDEEQRLEAEETSAPPPDGEDAMMQLDRMSTADLLSIGLNFVRQAESQSTRWLTGTIRHIYGDPPDDPALFPYWFASVAPISDDEKYKLLPTTSVRERVKIVARWIRRIESQRWFGGVNCTVL